MDPGLINPAEVSQKVALRFTGKGLTHALWICSVEPARCFNSENNASPTAQAAASELAWTLPPQLSSPAPSRCHSTVLTSALISGGLRLPIYPN